MRRHIGKLKPDRTRHDTLARFRRELKTFLFRQSHPYPSILLQFFFLRGPGGFHLGHVKNA